MLYYIKELLSVGKPYAYRVTVQETGKTRYFRTSEGVTNFVLKYIGRPVFIEPLNKEED